MTAISALRPSPIAGRWYEGDPTRLANLVDSYIADADLPELKGQVVGVVAPHAGHIYSGNTAGYAFKAVKGMSFEIVAVLSPLHSYHFSELLTTAHDAYQTPLGVVPVDKEALENLESNINSTSHIRLTPVAYDEEHSLEIELPFLQRALNGPFILLPLMIRSQEPNVAKLAGEAIGRVLEGKKALLVASTDLSHFYTEEEANKLDAYMLDQFAAFSPEAIFKADMSGKGFACGMAAVATLFWTAKYLGATRVQVLHHSTSGETTGDTNSVVGYGAAVILKDAS